ncbi:MAG: aminoacyl-tRNA hydrolase [Acholeplasmataceae bacterium]|nr:aminoacyl-tRNA hydrolase [Acholeplasmataceae bacterium]
MKLIVGLGNPGKAYDQTRHNVGFMTIDQWLEKRKQPMTFSPRFNAFIATMNVSSEKVIVIKPTTYMNLSGEAIRKTMAYHKIPIEDLLVVVDDVNLDTGRLRLRETGGHGGHNGLRNIIGILKDDAFKRIRIGVGNNTSLPLDRYVLAKFSNDEKPVIQKAIEKASEAIERFVTNDAFTDIMTTHNTQT